MATHNRSGGSRDEAGSGVCGSVHGKGYCWEAYVYLVFDLGLDPMNLIFDLDLYILNIYLRTKCSFYIKAFIS